MSDKNKRWAEITIQGDGIGVSLYENDSSELPVIIDETWFTDAEIDEIRANPSADGLVILDDDNA